jgi:4-hydroxy-tetrahydrodipicolinate synthase
LIDFHIANGTSGIVVVGTTGESPTVDVEEHCRLIKTAVDASRGRIPVVAGTGANSTAEAIALTEIREASRRAQRAVGGSVLQQAHPGRALRHFRAIAKRSICRFCSTTCRAAPSPIFRTTRFCVSPRSPASSASRTRRRI